MRGNIRLDTREKKSDPNLNNTPEATFPFHTILAASSGNFHLIKPQLGGTHLDDCLLVGTWQTLRLTLGLLPLPHHLHNNVSVSVYIWFFSVFPYSVSRQLHRKDNLMGHVTAPHSAPLCFCTLIQPQSHYSSHRHALGSVKKRHVHTDKPWSCETATLCPSNPTYSSSTLCTFPFNFFSLQLDDCLEKTPVCVTTY